MQWLNALPYLLMGMGSILTLTNIRIFAKRIEKHMNRLEKSIGYENKEMLVKIMPSPITRLEYFTTGMVFTIGLVAIIWMLLLGELVGIIFAALIVTSVTGPLYQLLKYLKVKVPIRLPKYLYYYSSVHVPVGLIALCYGTFKYILVW